MKGNRIQEWKFREFVVIEQRKYKKMIEDNLLNENIIKLDANMSFNEIS